MSRTRPTSGQARERLRRQAQAAKRARSPEAPAPTSRRAAATSCGWCGGSIAVKATGRIPKWCSHACRQRAWEQKRAAESGRSAVMIIERVMTASAPAAAATRRDWPAVLTELARELDRGRLYPRELPSLVRPLEQVLAAYRRAQK